MTPKKPVNGKTTFPPIPKEPKPRGLQIDLKMDPSIELLNSVSLFRREIKFVWLRLRGEVTQAGFPDGRIAEWFDTTDLRTFARSQDILFRATDVLIATPARNQITQIWEPIAQLIRNIAKQDAKRMEHPLKAEFRDLIRSTWIKAGGMVKAYASNSDQMFEFLKECQTTRRNPKAEFPPRSCVWGGGDGEMLPQYCWVYQDSFTDWLSTPSGKDRQYPYGTVRNALLMLDFQSKQLHRTRSNGTTSEEVNVRIWRGPIQLLKENPNLFESATQ